MTTKNKPYKTIRELFAFHGIAPEERVALKFFKYDNVPVRLQGELENAYDFAASTFADVRKFRFIGTKTIKDLEQLRLDAKVVMFDELDSMDAQQIRAWLQGIESSLDNKTPGWRDSPVVKSAIEKDKHTFETLNEYILANNVPEKHITFLNDIYPKDEDLKNNLAVLASSRKDEIPNAYTLLEKDFEEMYNAETGYCNHVAYYVDAYNRVLNHPERKEFLFLADLAHTSREDFQEWINKKRQEQNLDPVEFPAIVETPRPPQKTNVKYDGVAEEARYRDTFIQKTVWDGMSEKGRSNYLMPLAAFQNSLADLAGQKNPETGEELLIVADVIQMGHDNFKMLHAGKPVAELNNAEYIKSLGLAVNMRDNTVKDYNAYVDDLCEAYQEVAGIKPKNVKPEDNWDGYKKLSERQSQYRTMIDNPKP